MNPMKEYSAQQTLRLAKRVNNPKRSYLLVNPLQGKHMPVRPGDALDMMRALGSRLAEKYPDAKLIIGFAETATAIGAAVASCFPGDCVYMHTTREEIAGVENWVEFLEEHSHAAEQKLCGDALERRILRTKQLIFVEDELSTGKTLLNIVRQLRAQYPALADVQMVAASILNRLSPENERRLAEAGVDSLYLVKLPEADYTEAVREFDARPASDEALDTPDAPEYEVLFAAGYPDPRRGAAIGDYAQRCRQLARTAAQQLYPRLAGCRRVLVLGSEECMYPALVLGETLEAEAGLELRCHATTRSPIGVCGAEGYPIREGWHIRSFYSMDRNTYIYNLAQYDAAVIVSDTRADFLPALRDVAKALSAHGDCKIFYLGCGENI